MLEFGSSITCNHASKSTLKLVNFLCWNFVSSMFSDASLSHADCVSSLSLPGGAATSGGLYNPEEFRALNASVAPEIRDLFEYIGRYQVECWPRQGTICGRFFHDVPQLVSAAKISMQMLFECRLFVAPFSPICVCPCVQRFGPACIAFDSHILFFMHGPSFFIRFSHALPSALCANTLSRLSPHPAARH
jgi:hypothetical protein